MYQITVITGVRSRAGTVSNIQFILSGDQHDTGVRKLSDGINKVVYMNSHNSGYHFILSSHTQEEVMYII